MTFLVYSVSTALFFALTFYLRRQASKYISLPQALLLEVIVELILLFLIFVSMPGILKKGIEFHSKGFQFAILAGGTVTLAVVLNFLALRTTTLSKVVIITSPSQIIFGVLLGVLLTGESLTLKQILGTIIGIVGIILVVS